VLGDGVGADVGSGHLAHDRADVDEHAATAPVEEGEDRPRAIDVAEEVRLDDAAKVDDRRVFEPGEESDGGIVDPDVDPTEMLQSTPSQVVDSRLVGDVGRHMECLPTPPLAFHGNVAERPLAACGKNDTGPLLGELERCCLPNAARGTGDNDDEIFHLFPHENLLLDQR
jgi:hypothetical protein